MIPSFIAKFRFTLVSSILIFALAASSARLRAADSSDDQDRETCKKNLATIFDAIKAYRADNKDLPGFLSDLVPKYLKDPNILTCPTIKKTGTVKTFGIEDPNITTSYIYEFSDSPIPEQFSGGVNRTMKEWKRRQMGLIGSKVPMVRCHHHTPVLNLAFDGRIYGSTGGWESELKDEIDPADLSAGRLFAADSAVTAASKAQREIPPRDPKTPANLIDLSRFYNAALTESWHRNSPSEPPANDLSWLPRGLQKFAEIEFDTRGLIQLSSPKLNHPRFPRSVKNIKVDQKATRLHFLHGTGWSAQEGTPVASFIIRFVNGQKQQFTLLYGIHVIDWVAQDAEPKDANNSVLAWTGKSPATDNQVPLHIYKTQWINPTPEQTIATIDYVASNADPAPFLIAITAE